MFCLTHLGGVGISVKRNHNLWITGVVTTTYHTLTIKWSWWLWVFVFKDTLNRWYQHTENIHNTHRTAFTHALQFIRSSTTCNLHTSLVWYTKWLKTARIEERRSNNGELFSLPELKHSYWSYLILWIDLNLFYNFVLNLPMSFLSCLFHTTESTFSSRIPWNFIFAHWSPLHPFAFYSKLGTTIIKFIFFRALFLTVLEIVFILIVIGFLEWPITKNHMQLGMSFGN